MEVDEESEAAGPVSVEDVEQVQEIGKEDDPNEQDLNFDTTDSTGRLQSPEHDVVAVNERGDEDSNYDHDVDMEEGGPPEDDDDYEEMEELLEEESVTEDVETAPEPPPPVQQAVKKRVPDYIGDPIESEDEESDGGPPDENYYDEDSDSDQWDTTTPGQEAAEQDDNPDSDNNDEEDARQALLADEGYAETENLSQEDMYDEETEEVVKIEAVKEELPDNDDKTDPPKAGEDSSPKEVKKAEQPSAKEVYTSDSDSSSESDDEPKDIPKPTAKRKRLTSRSDAKASTSKEESFESDISPEQKFLMEEELRDYCLRELRSLQLVAYAEVIDALRAGGKLTKEKRDAMEKLRDVFQIPMERHKAEVRRALAKDELGVIADSVTDECSLFDWREEGYTKTVTEPRYLTYHVGRKEKVRLVLETINIEPEKSLFSKTYRGEDLPPRHCSITEHVPSDQDKNWELEYDNLKERIALPPDVELNIDVCNSSSDEDEIARELSTTRSRRGRIPPVAAKKEVTPKPKSTLELQKGRQQQTSPDITAPTASSPFKKPLTPAKPSKAAIKRKRKVSQAKSIGKEKTRKVIKFPTAAAVKQAAAKTKVKANPTTPKEVQLQPEGEDRAHNVEQEKPAVVSRYSGRGRGGRANGRGRGGGNGRGGGQKARLVNTNSNTTGSLETAEEMPSSPVMLTSKAKAKPKRRILKVKKPAAAQKQVQAPEQPPTKQRRKAKQEEIRDEGDYELEQMSARSRNRTSSPFSHYNNLLADANYPLSSELPAKMRHKTQPGLQSGSSATENYEHAELPKFNLNDEIQSHFSNALNRLAPTPISANIPPPRTMYSTSSIPPPVFSTTLNMNNFHKKRTQLLLPSTYQDLTTPGGSASTNDENSVGATASALAASRVRPPAVLSAASLLFKQGLGVTSASAGASGSTNNLVGAGVNSASPASSAGTFVRAQTPPILQRKATPHILSNSKLNRNTLNSVHPTTVLISSTTSPPNTNSLTASTSANSNSDQNSSTSPTTSLPPSSAPPSGNNHVLTGESLESAEAVAVAQLLDLQAQGQGTNTTFITSNNSIAASSNNFTVAPTSVVTSSSIPIVGSYARPPPGSNIIFVQKNPPGSVTGTMPAATPIMINSTNLSGMQLPVKSVGNAGGAGTPRTVIVRRTAAGGGAANVVLVDASKNQILNAAQFPQFIQGARFLNTQPVSLLNPPTAVATAASPARKVVNILPQQAAGPRKIRISSPTPTLVQSSSGMPIKPLVGIRPLSASGSNTTNTIPPMVKLIMPANNMSGTQSQPPPLQMVQRLIKAVPNSAMSLDGSQNTFLYTTVQNNDLSEIKISNVMSTSVYDPVTGAQHSIANDDGTGVQQFTSSTMSDDIFQLALKSSGLDFSGSPIYVTESTNPQGVEHQEIVYSEADTGDGQHESIQYVTQYNEMTTEDANLHAQSMSVPMEVVVSTGIESTQNS